MSTRMWILVVEDEPPMARILRKGLEKQNHTVTIAADGAEALAAARVVNVSMGPGGGKPTC